MLEPQEVARKQNRLAIIEEAELQQRALTDEEVIDLIRSVPTHYATVGKLSQGANVLRTDPNGKWVIFEDAAGAKKIQFDVSAASNVAKGPLGPGTGQSTNTGAFVDQNGKVNVVEGMHRLEAAQAGVQIPPGLGGIPGLPGWLEYDIWPPS